MRFRKPESINKVWELMKAQNLPMFDINSDTVHEALKNGMTPEQIVNAFKAEFDDEPDPNAPCTGGCGLTVSECINPHHCSENMANPQLKNTCPRCGKPLVRNGICETDYCNGDSPATSEDTAPHKKVYDETKAMSQGWILADTVAGLEIQRWDEGRYFESDYDALRSVKFWASTGDTNAQNALKAIADSLTTWAVQENKVEDKIDAKLTEKQKDDQEYRDGLEQLRQSHPGYCHLRWDRCDYNQQELIVALFNNQAFPLDVDRDFQDAEGRVAIWCEVIIHHPAFLEEDHPQACWDAIAERREMGEAGFLDISGHEGACGHGLYHTVHVPPKTFISCKATMGS
jgi:hypothetical protein